MILQIQRFFHLIRDAISHEGGFQNLIRKARTVYFKDGMEGFRTRIFHLKNYRQIITITGAGGIPYSDWVLVEGRLESAKGAQKALNRFSSKPLFSIICPTFNPDANHFRAAIRSVLAQIYPNWELCIADDCSQTIDVQAIIKEFSDDRIKFLQRKKNGNISIASNSALDIASGEYIALMDHDDTLSPFALFWVTERLNRDNGLKLIYSDEDKLDEMGQRCDPHFKPDWNYDYFLAHNYLCHLSVYDAGLVRKLGGFRVGLEGAQDYDLALRAIEVISANEIGHIPRILYHWRKHENSTSVSLSVKSYAIVAGKQAIENHLERQGINASVSIQAEKFRVHRQPPQTEPTVTILIPTRNQIGLLRKCIDTIVTKTTYSAYEIVVIDNGSDEREATEYLSDAQESGLIRVLADPRPFNFSSLINTGIRSSNSQYVCLMNNDIEVINPEWLEEMVVNCARPDVGVVGAKLLYSDNTIQHAGIVLGIGGVAGHIHKHFPAENYGYFHRLVLPQEVSAVTAACMVIDKSVYDQTSGFDEEELAIAFGDVDFCLKVRDNGFKVVWTPYALLMHHESKSRGLEDTPERSARFDEEFESMRKRWGSALTRDFAYNPNLSLATEDFSIANNPRYPGTEELI